MDNLSKGTIHIANNVVNKRDKKTDTEDATRANNLDKGKADVNKTRQS